MVMRFIEESAWTLLIMLTLLILYATHDLMHIRIDFPLMF